MAFRDDRVALRKRIESLETELSEVRRELEQTREELQKLRKQRRKDSWPYRLLKRWFPPQKKGHDSVRPGYILLGVVVGLLGIIGVVAFEVTKTTSPPAQPPGPLPALPGCTRWTGTATGNSTSELSFRLCIRDDRVEGMTQWVSHRAGWSRRSLAGTWDAAAKRMTVKEGRFAAQNARSGWKFCLVDSMVLSQISPTELSGTFRSKDCEDQGKIELKRVDDGPEAVGPDSSAGADGSKVEGAGSAVPSGSSDAGATTATPETSGPALDDGTTAPPRPSPARPGQDGPPRDRGF